VIIGACGAVGSSSSNKLIGSAPFGCLLVFVSQ